MLGAIIGDIVGSIYEFNNIKTTDFELFTDYNEYTDDSILTIATAKSLLESETSDFPIQELFTKNYKKYGLLYPSSYGNRFSDWLFSSSTLPYGSNGNGSAMRVSPVAWYGNSLEEVKALAEKSAGVTHTHPEGIKGAVATAECIYLARTGHSKAEILEVAKEFYPDDFTDDFTLDNIRETYSFDGTCQGTVPQAIEVFLESNDYEDTIRKAISIGGDSDTLAAIAGSIAEAYYGIPKELVDEALTYLEPEFIETIEEFYNKVINKSKQK